MSVQTRKRELRIFLACFLLAFLVNVTGIIQHGTAARELLTRLHIVLLFSVIFYFLAAILRMIYLLVSRLWNRD